MQPHSPLVALFLIATAVAPIPPQPVVAPDQEDSRDRAGVVAMWQRLEKAIKDGDVAARKECISTQAMVSVNSEIRNMPDGFSLVNREMAMDQLAKVSVRSPDLEAWMVDANVLVLPGAKDVALLLATSARRVAGYHGRTKRDFMTLHHEGGRWRVCMAFPCFVHSRLIAEDVVADSPAAKAGVRRGDIIVQYASEEMVSHQQLVEAIKRRQAAPSETKLSLLVRREAQWISLTVPPGPLGIQCGNLFEGDSDTVTLTGKAAAIHPASRVFTGYYEALARKDVPGMTSVICPGGCVLPWNTSPSTPTLLITPENAAELLAKEEENQDRQMKLNTFRVQDVRLILQGNLALVGGRITGQDAQGKPFTMNPVGCAVKYKGQWSTVGIPWQMGHALGMPPEAGDEGGFDPVGKWVRNDQCTYTFSGDRTFTHLSTNGGTALSGYETGTWEVRGKYMILTHAGGAKVVCEVLSPDAFKIWYMTEYRCRRAPK